MANYHVTKDKETGDWRAKREGADHAAGHYGTQADAEKTAKEMAANSGGGEVRIHSPKGPIRDSDTVAPGNDPFPPRDKSIKRLEAYFLDYEFRKFFIGEYYKKTITKEA